MKINRLLLASALLLSLYRLSAQITITTADMPNANDNILISVNTSLSNFHKDSTGANYTWDWSKLIPDSQRYVKFVSAASTPYSVPFNFISSFGTRNYTPDQLPWSLLGSPPTNVYDFYKKSAVAYTLVGEPLTEGTTVIPLPYSAADRVYKLPMNYLQKDSSNSVFSLPNIPGLGTYVKKQKRVNEVDGWGTLITPYGTFNTLRIKSTLTITDSIYIDTIGFGFIIPRPITYEFKWLASGMKIPLLEIDATAAGGNSVTITRANWRDSLMVTPSVSLIEQSTCPIINEGSLTANVTGGRYPLTYLWSNGKTTSSITNLVPGVYSVTITDRYGRIIHATDSVKLLTDSSCLILVNFTEQNTCPVINEGSLTANVIGGRIPLKYLWSNGDTTSTIKNLAPGTYSVTITDVFGRVVQAVDSVKVLTDSSCLILVNFYETKTCPNAKDGALSTTVTGGRIPLKYLWTTGDTTSAISNLATGNYNLTVTDKFGRQVTVVGTVDGFAYDLTCLNIPSGFTPDNDGVNDVWKIRSLSEYTTCKVEVFNQWGSLVFKSTGYNTPWDGKYNGEAVPAGAYYYVIDLDNNSKKFTGTVTIIK